MKFLEFTSADGEPVFFAVDQVVVRGTVHGESTRDAKTAIHTGCGTFYVREEPNIVKIAFKGVWS